MITLFKLLPKKGEKTLVFEMIYVLLVFSFDSNSCEQTEEYSAKKLWELKASNS